jgi:AAA family ATP:ADP antiporter
MFDVREGERLRTLFMAVYLLLVLFVHYILKPISRGMFLTRFNIDDLPSLYLLLAVVGGFLATVYTRVALQASLRSAVGWATAGCVFSFVAFWWTFQFNWGWLLYAFNLWANLFGVMIVAQGWLVAANVFTSREAKRVYGLVGLGGVAGGLAGSLFTRILVTKIGPRPLVLICALLIMLAYAAFRLAIAQKGVTLDRARAAEEAEAHVHVRDIVGAALHHRHLQVIIGIMTVIFLVDVLIDYQYNFMATQTYSGAELSAFFANFNLYANILTFLLQFFVTAAVVSRLGVGGTMQVMPLGMAAAAVPVLAAPGLLSTVAAGLAEKASRYSFNRTGMELLYMPLPKDLRNRAKAFVDVAVDRTGRGLAAVLLLALGVFGIRHPRQIAVLVFVFAILWALLSRRAQKEYILTVRRRLETRRLDLESARMAVSDPVTLALLEQAAAGSNPRHASYALSLLEDAPGYDLKPMLRQLVASPSAEVRGKVYELARALNFPDLLDAAMAERDSPRPEDKAAVGPAVRYVVTVAPAPSQLIGKFLDHSNTLVNENALEAIGGLGDAARDLIAFDWIAENGASTDPRRRRLAALAIGVHGDQGTEWLHRLLADSSPEVVKSACRSAGTLKNRDYLHALLPLLSEARLRAEAIDALAAFGSRICGTLGDLLEDETVPVTVRRQIPRVLRRIPHQRGVNVLLRSIGDLDLSIRAAALKALNRLRETAPQLDYGETFVTRQILSEARYYFELHAALEPLRCWQRPRTASGLLARTIEERLTQTMERLFRLLGLRYPPKEIYEAYLAVKHRGAEELSEALDFLENVLDRELKRTLMPLLDSPGHLGDRGRELFGIEAKTAESAIQQLIQSADPWLVACAMSAAAELNLRNLAPEIVLAAQRAGREVSVVARSAAAALV